jgi:hypothetical protein
MTEEKVDAEKRKMQMEAMQKQMEEQKKVRMQQLEMSLKQLKITENLVLKTVDRMKAERDSLKNVDLAEEQNEFKKKLLSSQVAEMEAMVENEEFKLEMIKFNEDAIKQQMEQLEKMPAAAMMAQGMGR